MIEYELEVSNETLVYEAYIVELACGASVHVSLNWGWGGLLLQLTTEQAVQYRMGVADFIDEGMALCTKSLDEQAIPWMLTNCGNDKEEAYSVFLENDVMNDDILSELMEAYLEDEDLQEEYRDFAALLEGEYGGVVKGQHYLIPSVGVQYEINKLHEDTERMV